MSLATPVPSSPIDPRISTVMPSRSALDEIELPLSSLTRAALSSKRTPLTMMLPKPLMAPTVVSEGVVVPPPTIVSPPPPPPPQAASSKPAARPAAVRPRGTNLHLCMFASVSGRLV